MLFAGCVRFAQIATTMSAIPVSTRPINKRHEHSMTLISGREERDPGDFLIERPDQPQGLNERCCYGTHTIDSGGRQICKIR
jgi:hypothetical protein